MSAWLGTSAPEMSAWLGMGAAETTAWLESFWRGMYAHLWQTTLVLAFLWALSRLLRDAPARFHSRLWWMALIKLFLPLPLIAPLVERVGEAMSGWLSGPTWQVVTRWAIVLEPPGLGAPAPAAEPGSPFAGWPWMVLTGLWLGGIGAVLWLRCQTRSRRVQAPVPLHACDDPLRSKALAALRGTGVGEADVLLTGSPVMPCVIGLRRSRLLLPLGALETLPADELRAVILHEQAHRRRRDPLRASVETVALALFFFYPPAWLVVARLARSAEFDCDEAVLRAGLPSRTFARALARVIDANLRPAAGLALGTRNTSALRERIERLERSGGLDASPWHRVAVGVGLLAVALFSVVPGSWGQVAARPGQEPQQERPRRAVTVRRAHPELDPLNGVNERLSVNFGATPLRRVARELARDTGLNIVVDPDVPETSVTLQARNTSLRIVLALLADQAGVAYEVPRASMLRIRRAPFRVGGDIQAPELVERVDPVYPETARRARLEGVVILEVLIDTEGVVRDAKVLRGLGLGLDEAALAAVRQWRYSPTLYNGRPVEVQLTVTVQFQLIE